jgi:adenylosuccinate synthase
VRTYEDLPEQARNYLDFISDYLGIPIALIGVGPARDQIIWTDASRVVEQPAAAA